MGELGRDIYNVNDSYHTNDSCLNDVNTAPDLTGAILWMNQVVYNRQREQVGYIKDFKLDVQSGEITHAVLMYKGSVDWELTELTVPWSALIFDSSLYAFTLDAIPDALAPVLNLSDYRPAGTDALALRLVGNA